MPGEAVVAIKDKQWSVAVANTYTELTSGLSEVESLPAQTGMLFDMGTDYSDMSIDMSRMLFPLDIIFINSTQGVVGVLHDVQSGEDAYFSNNALPGARCFLEVNAGEAEGIEVGDSVDIQGYTQPAQTSIDSLVNFMFAGMVVIMMSGLATRALKPTAGKPVLYGPRGERLLPQAMGKGKFVLKSDRMGNIIMTHTERTGDVFLQFESDKELVYDLLKKGERKDLDAGWPVEIKDTEPRASILNELWESAGPGSFPATQFVKIGDRVRYLAHERGSKYRRGDWPEGVWLGDKEVDGTVTEYHPRLPAFGDIEAIEAWAVVKWDNGAKTAIESKDEGKGWERVLAKQYKAAVPKAEADVKPSYLKEKSPAVIPTDPTLRPKREDELEYLADSPEFLAYTIEDIGYREKLDNAFQEAITRAKHLPQIKIKD